MSENIQENPLFQEAKSQLHPQDFEVVKQILNRYEFDLFPTHGFFTANDFDKITEQARNDFLRNLINMDSLDAEDIYHQWREIVLQFQKDYWGYKKHLQKPDSFRVARQYDLPLLPDSQIPKKPSKPFTFKEAFFYVWAVLQSWILIKALILVYGNDLAKDDSLRNRIIFGTIIAFSFSSLFLFAWLRRKKRK